MPPRIPSGTAISVAAPVISSVPTTAGPMPGPGSRSENGSGSVRNVPAEELGAALDHVADDEHERNQRDHEREHDQSGRDHVR